MSGEDGACSHTSASKQCAPRLNNDTARFNAPFPSKDVERYSRQMLLPELGVRGQSMLTNSKALVIGLGGLGCPAAIYLAGAGVGTIGLVDRPGDVVEISNLHRQIAHAEDRVGSNKVESAAIAIKALNSNVEIQKHEEFAPRSAASLVAQYDIVLDCTDNVSSRYLASDACAASRTPLVSGSAIGLAGQLTVYCLSEETPCYRCVFPFPPPPSCVGSCASSGVLGPVAGTIGTLQALEALKILGGIDRATILESRLLLFDAADMVFRTVKLRGRAKNCVACSLDSEFSLSSFDYQLFALGGKEARTDLLLSSENRIGVRTLAEMCNKVAERPFLLLDVRPKEQFDMCSLPGSVNIPMNALRADTSAFRKSWIALGRTNSSEDLPIVVICRRGNQSQDGVRILQERGYISTVDVEGGLQEWHREVDSSFPLY